MYAELQKSGDDINQLMPKWVAEVTEHQAELRGTIYGVVRLAGRGQRQRNHRQTQQRGKQSTRGIRRQAVGGGWI